MFGMMNGNDFRTFIGFGILAYGIGYFLVHEVLIHRRFHWFDKTDNLYFRAIRKAHKVHHKNQFKEEAECFGMLVVPFKYFKAEQRFKQAKASK
jgi:beta-carotene 3-hydroxylase